MGCGIYQLLDVRADVVDDTGYDGQAHALHNWRCHPAGYGTDDRSLTSRKKSNERRKDSFNSLIAAF